MNSFCSVVVCRGQETWQPEFNLTKLSPSVALVQRGSLSLCLPLLFQLPHKGQGRSLKSTGPPRPASASNRDMMTAMAASSLLGLLEPGSSMMSMLRWELSPGWKTSQWEKDKQPCKVSQSVRECVCVLTHSWWTGWSRGSLQNQVQEWSLCLAAQVSLHSESIQVTHIYTRISSLWKQIRFNLNWTSLSIKEWTLKLMGKTCHWASSTASSPSLTFMSLCLRLLKVANHFTYTAYDLVIS